MSSGKVARSLLSNNARCKMNKVFRAENKQYMLAFSPQLRKLAVKHKRTKEIVYFGYRKDWFSDSRFDKVRNLHHYFWDESYVALMEGPKKRQLNQ